MSRLTSNKLQGAVETLWNLAKGSLMIIGLVALVAWEMQTFSYAKPATIPDAGPPVLSSVQPLKVKAATAAQAFSRLFFVTKARVQSPMKFRSGPPDIRIPVSAAIRTIPSDRHRPSERIVGLRGSPKQ